MDKDRKNILVVDDEEEICDLLEVYLISEGFVVYKCHNAKEALDCLEKETIHLAILDVMMPDMDGFILCRKIREQWFFPIIMLTAKVEEMDKIKGITFGADDYMTKPFQPLELIARVKAQLRRAEVYNKSVGKASKEYYEIRGLEVDAEAHMCRLYGEKITLTPLEFSILLYLCRHLGQVATSEEIFESVWKEKYLDNNNTVFVHVARIREKLHEDSRKPKFIKTVWGVGYKLEE